MEEKGASELDAEIESSGATSLLVLGCTNMSFSHALGDVCFLEVVCVSSNKGLYVSVAIWAMYVTKQFPPIM